MVTWSLLTMPQNTTEQLLRSGKWFAYHRCTQPRVFLSCMLLDKFLEKTVKTTSEIADTSDETQYKWKKVERNEEASAKCEWKEEAVSSWTLHTSIEEISRCFFVSFSECCKHVRTFQWENWKNRQNLILYCIPRLLCKLLRFMRFACMPN